VRYLEGFDNRVIFAWAPVDPIFELGRKAKQLAQRSTDEGRVTQDQVELSKRAVQKSPRAREESISEGSDDGRRVVT
jgi:hypothetical protein